jgi:hypothetical protein
VGEGEGVRVAAGLIDVSIRVRVMAAGLVEVGVRVKGDGG